MFHTNGMQVGRSRVDFFERIPHHDDVRAELSLPNLAVLGSAGEQQ